jgi:hypothetical protein
VIALTITYLAETSIGELLKNYSVGATQADQDHIDAMLDELTSGASRESEVDVGEPAVELPGEVHQTKQLEDTSGKGKGKSVRQAKAKADEEDEVRHSILRSIISLTVNIKAQTSSEEASPGLLVSS